MIERKQSVSVRVLLLSSDNKVIQSLSQTARPMAIQVEACNDPELAITKLSTSKFEGVIVDLALKQGFNFLTRLRALSSNKSAVSYAVLSQNLEQLAAFQAGANFVFERPVSHSAARVFKASYSLMVREKRRYFRYPMKAEVLLRFGGEAEFPGMSLNLSEAGISLNSGRPTRVGSKISLRLRLPGGTEYLQLAGEVCWAEPSGRMGIHLRNLAPEVAQTLREFLTEQVEEALRLQPATASQQSQ